MPSVRGRQRANVIVAGIVAATASGAIAGFAIGIGWYAVGTVWAALSVSPVAPRVAAAVIVVALVLDGLAARWHRLAAPSTRRQVPRLWSTVFAPPTTASLYGARLGVGPLTILPTWLWWAAIVTGAAVGPLAAAAAGATFGAARLTVVVVASLWVEGHASARVARLTVLRRRVAVVLSGIALVVAGAALLSAGDSPPRLGDRPVAAAAGRPSADEALPATAESPTRLAATDAHNGDPLAPLLPVEVRGDYEPVASHREGLGPIDMAEAAAVESDPEAERALLETRGFERGFARAWERDGGVSAYAMVYRFGEAEQAAAYRTDGFITLEGRGATLYDVAAVPEGRGFSQVDRRAAGTFVSHGVAWVEANDFFLVFVSGPGSTVSTDDATALATTVSQ